VALKRAFRLRKSSEFLQVRQQGRSIASRLLILAYRANTLDITRIGFVVSKKVSKHAVVRNHLKRLLSEVVRPLLPCLPGGLDIVLTVRNAARDADILMLKQEVVTLLQRARLLETGQAPETSD
jgi:ribonuclease P protein component